MFSKACYCANKTRNRRKVKKIPAFTSKKRRVTPKETKIQSDFNGKSHYWWNLKPFAPFPLSVNLVTISQENGNGAPTNSVGAPFPKAGSDQIEKDEEVMGQTASDDKEMEEFMEAERLGEIRLLDHIDDPAGSVERSPQNQKIESHRIHIPIEVSDKKHDHPSHKQVEERIDYPRDVVEQDFGQNAKYCNPPDQ